MNWGIEMQSNLEKYKQTFLEVFQLNENQLNEFLMYQSVPTWDSVGHMELISSLEEVFQISFDMDDVIDFSSFNKGKEILKKYQIEM